MSTASASNTRIMPSTRRRYTKGSRETTLSIRWRASGLATRKAIGMTIFWTPSVTASPWLSEIAKGFDRLSGSFLKAAERSNLEAAWRWRIRARKVRITKIFRPKYTDLLAIKMVRCAFSVSGRGVAMCEKLVTQRLAEKSLTQVAPPSWRQMSDVGRADSTCSNASGCCEGAISASAA